MLDDSGTPILCIVLEVHLDNVKLNLRRVNNGEPCKIPLFNCLYVFNGKNNKPPNI